MKTGFFRSAWRVAAVAACAAMLTSCKPRVAETPPEPEPPPITPAPAATPLPSTPVAVAPTPVPDPLAPPGMFYLLQNASITTDDGIIGLKPGTLLRQTAPGTYAVEGHEVKLPDHQVTNNLRIAGQYASAAASAQAAIRQTLQQRAAEVAQAQATPTPPPARTTSASARSAPPGSSALGSGTGAADPEYGNRKNQRMDTKGRLYWRDSRGVIRYD